MIEVAKAKAKGHAVQSHLQLHKCLAETITNSYAKVPNCQWSFSTGETFTPLNVSRTCEQKEVPAHAPGHTAPQFLVLWQGFAGNFVPIFCAFCLFMKQVT